MDGGSLPCLSSLVWWRASSGGGGDVQLGEPLAGKPSRAPRSRRGTSANILLSLSLSPQHCPRHSSWYQGRHCRLCFLVAAWPLVGAGLCVFGRRGQVTP